MVNTNLSKKTGPAQCGGGQVAHKGQANQVMVDYTGVKESNAIFAAVSNLLSALALELFLTQAACARVTEMGRDRPFGGRIKLLACGSGTATENLKFQGWSAALTFSWPSR